MSKKLHLLIVEGNPENIRVNRATFGITEYYKQFTGLIDWLGFGNTHDIAYPADSTENLPGIDKLKEYDGILLTGSALNAYDDVPEVTNQLDFLDRIFETGVPVYGSCWGMQIATVVAGGKVEPAGEGREFGISELIELTDEGKQSPFYQGKPQYFNSLCIHLDEVTEPAANSVILSTNSHSDVQALTLRHKKSDFFGVQYHPEFTSKEILGLSRAMAKIWFGHDIYIDNLERSAELMNKISPFSISDRKIHTLEIANWLKHVAG